MDNKVEKALERLEEQLEEKELMVLDYDDSKLRNFNLLNQIEEEEEEEDIETLKNKIKEAIDKEDYKVADELTKELNKRNGNE